MFRQKTADAFGNTAQLRHRYVAQALLGLPWWDHGQAIRFVQLGGKLGGGPVTADADRAQHARGTLQPVQSSPYPRHEYTRSLLKAVPIADPRKRKSEKDLNFKPIPSPIFPVGHEPGPSVYEEVAPGHLVLKG